MKKTKTFFQDAARAVRHASAEDRRLSLQETVRNLRKAKGLSGVDLCRRGGLDPKVLNAVEKGRIKNPSLATLQALAAGLELSVSDLFRKAELELPVTFKTGGQKGAFHLEFPSWGLRMVVLTPLIREFFFGKLIFSGKSCLRDQELRHPHPIFLSILTGRFEVRVGEKQAVLKEGENLFFRGTFPYSIQNLHQRESVLFLLTAPSLLIPSRV